ncbi:20152_t:CDS:1, partial [Gigaspora rosea]
KGCRQPELKEATHNSYSLGQQLLLVMLLTNPQPWLNNRGSQYQ